METLPATGILWFLAFLFSTIDPGVGGGKCRGDQTGLALGWFTSPDSASFDLLVEAVVPAAGFAATALCRFSS